jgi:hypothetical protein
MVSTMDFRWSNCNCVHYFVMCCYEIIEKENLKYWCRKACGRRRFMEYIGVKLPQKKMQDTDHCPESKKRYKMKQGTDADV